MISYFHTLHLFDEVEYVVCGYYEIGSKGITITSIAEDGIDLIQPEFTDDLSPNRRLNIIESLMRKLTQHNAR